MSGPQNVVCQTCGILVKQISGFRPQEGRPYIQVPNVIIDVSEEHLKKTGHWNFVDAPPNWAPPQPLTPAASPAQP